MALSKAKIDDYWLFVVDGYVREENKSFDLNVPDDINKLICIPRGVAFKGAHFKQKNCFWFQIL